MNSQHLKLLLILGILATFLSACGSEMTPTPNATQMIQTAVVIVEQTATAQSDSVLTSPPVKTTTVDTYTIEPLPQPLLVTTQVPIGPTPPARPTATPSPLALLNIHAQQGGAYLLEGRYEEAIKEYHRIFEIDQIHGPFPYNDEYAVIYYNLGLAYYYLDDAQYAEEALAFQKAIELNPRVLVDKNLDVLEAIITVVKEHITLSSRRGTPLVWCEGSIIKISDPSEADAKEADQILTNNPEDLKALETLATYYRKRGNYEAALVYQQKLVDLAPTAIDFYILGTVLQNLARNDEAIKAYSRAVEVNPFLIDPHSKLMTLYIDKNQTNKAIAHYTWVYALCPSDEIKEDLLRAVRTL